MKYFTEDLNLIKENVIELQNKSKEQGVDLDEISKTFTEELLEVNKLLTIEKYLKIKSNFYKERFYSIITSNTPDAVIPNYGIGMSKEEFQEYLDKYNEQFELI